MRRSKLVVHIEGNQEGRDRNMLAHIVAWYVEYIDILSINKSLVLKLNTDID